MTSRRIFALLAIALATGLEYFLLYRLGSARIDPVIIIGATSESTSGLQFSPGGAAAWLLVILAYSGSAVFLGNWICARRERKKTGMIRDTLLVTVLAATIAVVLHPTLLMATLPPMPRAAYFAFVRAHVGFLADVYEHWAIGRIAPVAAILQSLAVGGMVILSIGLREARPR